MNVPELNPDESLRLLKVFRHAVEITSDRDRKIEEWLLRVVQKSNDIYLDKLGY